MGATASLSLRAVTIEPGRSAVIDVLVRNTGAVVDELTLRVLGEAAGWALLEPASLSLFPQTEGSVRVTFSPPRASTPAAGILEFGVMVSSREDTEGSVVEEGTIEITPFTDTFAELVPHARQARRAASYRLAVDNRGNVAVAPTVAATSPAGDLEVAVRPRQVDIPRGTTVFLRVTANATRWMWRGSARSHPFSVQVAAAEQDASPLSVDGVMLQGAILPSWFFKALLLLLALLLILAALWFGLLRPNIRSQARAVALQQSAKTTKQANKAVMAADQAKKSAGAANKAATSAATQASTAAQAATKATGKPFTTTTTTLPGSPSTSPTGGRVVLSVPPGKTISQTLAGIPAKKSFQLTDVVFENPDGDSGTVSVMRGSSVLLLENLATFRDLDYHFVSPISFPAGMAVTFSGTCANPASAKQPCQPAVYLGGYLG
ncbi:MAG: hypothetical protein ACRDX8_01505 [Acidimicrobiales bacterium]